MMNLKNRLKMFALVGALASSGLVWSQTAPPPAAPAPVDANRPSGAGVPGARVPGGRGGASPFHIEREIEYAVVGNRALHLDLYLRDTSDKKPLPVVVWVHGGGWGGGDKSPSAAARLVANGYAVASVEYRLSGEAPFPAQLYDVKAAVRWLRANASKYNLDGAHIGAWGNSAGGHLVALLGTTGDVKELEGDVGDNQGNLDQSSRVQAVVDFYGPIDLMRMDATATKPKSDDPKLAEAILLGGVMSKNAAQAKAANPITYITPDDPPFLIVHGTADQTVPPVQSEFLQVALKHAGVENTLEYVPGAGHSIQQVQTPAIAEVVNNFFDKYLRNNQHQRDDVNNISEPPDSWIDPFPDELPGTQYKLFATATRGPNTQASYRIYFPPGYELPENAKRKYPVIYYLHGFSNDSRSAVLSGYIPRLDAAIRMGYMPPTIVVAVQVLNDGTATAPVQSVIVEDLIPHIDKTYRTVATRDGRAIEGHSFGGDYSLRIGFKYIDLFTSVAGLSPALGVPVNASQEIITPGTPPITELPSRVDEVWSWLDTNADKIRGRTFIRLIIGDKDTLIYRAKLMSDTLTKLKIEHSFTEAQGSPHSIKEVLSRVNDNPFIYYGKVFAKFK